MGIGPIPYDQIRDYGIEKGLESDNLECFKLTIRTMDEVFIKWQAEESERSRKK